MEEKKDQEAQVKFRGVSPFGQTTESDAIPNAESGAGDRAAVVALIHRGRPRTVKTVLGNVLPVLQQVLAAAPELELSHEAAATLRLAVAAVAKEGLVRTKK